MRSEIRIAGLGGQGIITSGLLLGEAASVYDGKETVMTEAYSPYITGGWSRADLIISDQPIDYPAIKKPAALIAFSQEAYDTYASTVKRGGCILVEKTLVEAKPIGLEVKPVPAVAIAEELGRKVIANIVMLGAFSARLPIISHEAILKAITKRFRKAAELNTRAFNRGRELVEKGLS